MVSSVLWHVAMANQGNVLHGVFCFFPEVCLNHSLGKVHLPTSLPLSNQQIARIQILVAALAINRFHRLYYCHLPIAMSWPHSFVPMENVCDRAFFCVSH